MAQNFNEEIFNNLFSKIGNHKFKLEKVPEF